MRELTRPEGKEAVDKVTVSGTWPRSCGDVNHEWNWVNGSGERSERRRRESENCAARDGVGVGVVVEAGAAESGGASPGATEERERLLERGVGVLCGGGGINSMMSTGIRMDNVHVNSSAEKSREIGVRHAWSMVNSSA
jgi:hypothetical protein